MGAALVAEEEISGEIGGEGGQMGGEVGGMGRDVRVVVSRERGEKAGGWERLKSPEIRQNSSIELIAETSRSFKLPLHQIIFSLVQLPSDSSINNLL